MIHYKEDQSMTVLYLLLLALAGVCFLASTFGYNVGPTDRPRNLASLGLLFWVLVPLIETARNLH